MLIKNYGLFWHRDEVEWEPGCGGRFRLPGRRGATRGNLSVVDFRWQQGIYILYGNYGAYYVGLTREGFGNRIKAHLYDDHQSAWNRFSWFGFRSVLRRRDESGFCELKEMSETTVVGRDTMIADVEALLIRAMGVSNINQMSFSDADEWHQIELHEVGHYLNKLDA